jgi:anti-anti-sigma factor
MLNFDLETESQGSSALVRIRGDLDLQVVDQVTEAFAGVEAKEPKRLIVDLSRLTFLDSSGMGVIAAAHLRAQEADREFAVVIPPAGVRQAFERTKLTQVMEITDDVAKVFP